MHQSSSDIFNSPERCSAGGSGRGRSRWGVFSVVLGVLGIAVGWVPFIGFVGIVFGAIGLVLAIRAISRKGVPRGLSVTGAVLSVLAVIRGVVWLFVPVSSLIPGTSSHGGGDSKLFPELKADPFALGTSTSYSLWATGHGVVHIAPAADESSPSPAEISFDSSWEKDLVLKDTHGIELTVTGEKDQQVSCSIAVNQSQTRTRTSTGTVTCKVSTLAGDPDHVDEQLAPTP